MWYIFKNPNSDEKVQVWQNMNDDHSFKKNGVKWQRIFTTSNIGIDTKIDPFSKRDFVNKTGQKRMTTQDFWEKSQELSEKRTKVDGFDKVKEKYYSDWSKRRNNKKVHRDIEKVQVKESLKKSGVILEE